MAFSPGQKSSFMVLPFILEAECTFSLSILTGIPPRDRIPKTQPGLHLCRSTNTPAKIANHVSRRCARCRRPMNPLPAKSAAALTHTAPSRRLLPIAAGGWLPGAQAAVDAAAVRVDLAPRAATDARACHRSAFEGYRTLARTPAHAGVFHSPAPPNSRNNIQCPA